jgi:YfiH family protein
MNIYEAIFVVTPYNLMLLYFKNLSKFPNIRHFVSTRQNGVSDEPYKGLNIGFGTDDLPENVVQNRKILAEEAQIPLENWCVPQQTHSTHILNVSRLEKGKGAFSKTNALPNTDALISKTPHIGLVVQSADCVCSLYYDPVKKVIGACHAGWRGAVGKLPQKVILQMQKDFGCNPKDVVVGVGTCISAELYEVGEDVVEAVENAFGTKENFLFWNEQNQKYHLHLHYTHLHQLKEVGVLEENIEFMQECTYKHPELFFSARRDKNKTGRFGAGIMLL